MFVLIPFADVIRRSFFKAVGNTFVGLTNYQDVLENKAFQQAALHTLKFLSICLPLLLALSFGAALLLYHIPTGKALFQTVFLLPMASSVPGSILENHVPWKWTSE